MPDNERYQKIFNDLTDTVILTPNRRLAATLHKIHHAYQLAQQKQCWQTPRILPITSFLQQLWYDYSSQEFSKLPLLLNAAQERFLWEKTLLTANNTETLLQLTETAEIARTAWGLLKQWQVDVQHSLFASAEDYHAFQFWAIQFQQMMHGHHWLETASLMDEITTRIKKITLPKKIILMGFTEISPQFKNFLMACATIKTTVIYEEVTATSNQCQRLSCQDAEDEWLTMARWAKAMFQQNNNIMIGCVVPSLEKNRDRIAQIFSEVFASENSHIIAAKACPFNISAGKNLLQYPIIYTALQLLQLHKKTISLELFSYLLSSPFLGEAEIERLKRYTFDSALRQANMHSIDLIALLENREIKLSLGKNCYHLANRLQRFFSLIAQHHQSVPYAQWAIIFNELLKAIGWPGERSLNSEEYQIVDSWKHLLMDFSALDQIASPVTMHEAMQTLMKMAKKTIFQPKTPDAPIQILGVLEAAGIPFDYLWLTGMDDLSWPPQPKPNPLLPKRLQRELQMPHATAERELTFCNKLITQFIQNGHHVIFSHAEKNQELELQASPLIRHFAEITFAQLSLETYQTPSEKIFLTKKMEALLDERAPPLQANEKIRGGVNVLKHQALCPFKSFAEWRLHAHPLENPLPGLRSQDRGIIVHKILEIIWKRLKNQAALIAMPDAELKLFIQHCIDETLNDFPHSRQDCKQYFFLEKKRLQKLIADWLILEKNRADFKVILNEEALQITLKQLTLSLRIDRIDELADGKKLIIDYKTGKNNEINNWFSERPEEPQLPLYSLFDPSHTTGITFAQIAPGENCFKGISRYALDIQGIKIISEIKKISALSWEEQLSQWQAALEKLSDDFSHGIASVDPKDPEQTCTWCTLKPFCRIQENVDAVSHHHE